MGDPSAAGSRDLPNGVYEARLADRREVVAARRRAGEALSWVRLSIVIAGLLLGWLALFAGRIGGIWLLLPLAAFIAVLVVHDRVIRQRLRAERAATFYERGLQRLGDRWAGEGNPGERFLDPRHPYASDLDLFGRGSLFELLCAARTVSGERTLARWLCAAVAPEEVLERQEAVQELRPRLDLREELALLGEEVRGGFDPDELSRWAAAPPALRSHGWRIAASVLAATNVVTLGLWGGQLAGPLPFAASALCSVFLAGWLRSGVRRVLGGIDRHERELELLALILSRLERERFQSPLLVRLREKLDSRGKPPSRRIAQLARLVQLNDSRHNMIFQPFAALLLLGTQLAFAMERWRSISGPAVERWLAAVGSIEALSSLAGFAYENPEDPFPKLVEEGPLYDGAELGHPLLPRSRCVRNDVKLDATLPLLIVSGSNMSGKSTLLRTIGVNAVLALAGAPVRAASLRLSPLSVGTSMRALDSLQEGLSHFYAEIQRLRHVVELGNGERPLLFLLDEILHGTNSHDRRVGAEALVRGLVGRGGVGLITTHDLALAEIADKLDPPAENVHFEDHLDGERIAFDFKLRPGVVSRGNALALMRAAGLGDIPPKS